MMSIVLLYPVLDAMASMGCDEDALASQLRLSASQMRDPATVLPARKVYQFLAWATERSLDRCFCAHVGQSMARGAWSAMNPLLQNCQKVWDLLRKFSSMAADQGGSASYRLEVEGNIALWKLTRPQGAPKDARFADALATGFFVDLIVQAGHDRFSPNDMLAIVPDNELIPPDILPRTSVIPGASGMTLRFPSDWLDWHLAELKTATGSRHADLPDLGESDLRTQVRRLLEQNLADAEFGIDDIAEAIGVPRWKLQRTLRLANTSVADLRNDARLSKARDLLTSRSMSVSEIATVLGYANPSNFARAFRTMTGKTPTAFRTRPPI